MNKKKQIVAALILSAVLTFIGALLKMIHFQYANWILSIGLIIHLIFWYLLIVFFIKSKK